MKKKNSVNVLVEVSARHIHLSEKDKEKLFGRDYQLQVMRRLSQPSEFACQETLTIQVNNKKIERVRVVGPFREKTQVEISQTDAVFLGIEPPLRLSGDLKGSLPVTLIGPKGVVHLKEGLILAQRHLHCAPQEALKLGIRDRQSVAVEIKGSRALIFYNVKVRAKEGYSLAVHLDTDEGNAAGIKKKGRGLILL